MPVAFDVITIISNERWGDVWYSKHHYAHELSRLGHRVYFIDPVLRWRFSDLFSFRINSKPVAPKLHVISYRNNFPVRMFPKWFSALNDWINGHKLKRFFGGARILWWQFDHRRFAFIKTLNPVSRIYHVADPYMKAPNNDRIAKLADLIVCTSANYLPYYAEYDAAVLHVPHAISAEESAVDRHRVKEIEGRYPNCMVLIGSINGDVDFELLQQLVQDLKTPLLVIGKEATMDGPATRAWQSLKERVVYLGPVHARELKHYIAAARVCLVPYRFDLKKAVGTGSPLKALNYLAQHKPVVSSIDSEIAVLEGRAIYRAQDREEFVQLVQKGLAGQLNVDDKAVDQYLSEHTYEAAIEKILGALSLQE